MHHERLSTKVYLILCLISITILITYTSLINRNHSEFLMNPSIQDYERLQVLYGNILQCLCSKNDISRRLFIIELKAILHPICTSHFIKDTLWIEWLNGMQYDISWLVSHDFRQWGSSLFVWIESFCSLINSTISNAITTYQSRPLITIQPMSRNQFQSQTNLELDRFLTDIRKDFLQALQLYPDTMQGNGLMSLFSTNWMPVVEQRYNVENENILLTGPIIYNSSCSCAISRTCMKPAGIYEQNETLLHTIDGIMHACFLLESFLASSLSCFYSNFCSVSFFLSTTLGNPDGDYTPWYNHIFRPEFPLLNRSLLQHFSINDTFATIVNELFIDVWSTNTSYQSFFNQYCTYLVKHRFDFLYVLMTFLSLYTGITFVLYIIIPRIIRMVLLLKEKMRIRP